MKQIQKILMATDFSDTSAPAWRKAVEMAEESGAELLVAHAYAPPQIVEMGAMAPRLYDDLEDYLRSETGKKLQLLVEDAARRGVVARPLVLVGNPEEAILDAALKNHADVLVVGTHGRKGVSRFFLGSVATRLIASAPCPVLTVRMDASVPGLRPADENAFTAPLGP